MLAYAMVGQKRNAIRQYDACRKALAEELQAEPSLETQLLHQRIASEALTGIEAAPRNAAFIGRHEEIAALEKCVDGALAGRGQTRLLTAEPGAGKTRTAARIAQYATMRGMNVLWGRCYEGEGAPGLWPWTQVLRSSLDQLRDGGLDEIPHNNHEYISQLVPELYEAGDPPPPDDSEQARFQMFQAVASALQVLSRRAPIMIVLDDLQGADQASLLLLSFAARSLASARVFILATTRAVAGLPGHPVAEAVVELSRESSFQELRLEGLSPAETGELVAALSGTSPAPECVAAIHERTEGNPFYVTEIVRGIPSSIALSDAGAAQEVNSLLPSTVRGAISVRLEALSDECRRVLTLASVFGRQFRIQTLGLAAGLAVAVVLGILQEALDEQLIAVSPDDPGRFMFLHALIMSTLYEAVPVAERRRVHEQVGGAIASISGGNPELAAELAFHYVEAARAGGDVRLAVQYSLEASEAAMKLTAYEEAVRQLETARSIGHDAPAHERTRILIRLGEALRACGRITDCEQALKEAIDLARLTGDASMQEEAALAMAPRLWYGGSSGRSVPEETIRLMEEATTLCSGQTTATHAALLARLAIAYSTHWQNDPAQEAAFEAESIARSIGNPALIAEALGARFTCAFSSAEGPAARLAIAREMLEFARFGRSLEAQSQAIIWKNTCQLELGDGTSWDSSLNELARLTDKTQLPSMQWTEAILRATAKLIRGDFEEGERLARNAADVGRGRIDYPVDLVYMCTHQFITAYFVGNLELLAQAYSRVALILPELDAVAAQLAYAMSEAGNLDDARETYRKFADTHFQQVKQDESWLYAICCISELALALDDRAAYRDLIAILTPHAHECAIATDAVVWWGSASHFLGKLHAALGEHDKAAEYFERALGVHLKMQSPPFVALTQYEYAKALVSSCCADSLDLAAQMLAEADATTKRLGMTRLAEKIERVGGV
jgi:tetratricopeptide (TPR) repeat protein